MILILANVFIAILSDAYNAINTEQKDEKLNISKNLSKTYKNFINTIKRNLSLGSFSSIDKDKNGQIDAVELKEATGLQQKDAEMVINIFDTNNDGNLNKEEMIEFQRVLTKTNVNNIDNVDDNNKFNEMIDDIIDKIGDDMNNIEFSDTKSQSLLQNNETDINDIELTNEDIGLESSKISSISDDDQKSEDSNEDSNEDLPCGFFQFFRKCE